MLILRRTYDAAMAAAREDGARRRDGEVAALEREAAFLREQVGMLTDHRRRMERVGRGLSEMEPRRVEPGTRTGQELSPHLKAYVLSFESGPMRHAAQRSIEEALLAGSTCEQIEADIEPEVWAALGITTNGGGA
jgi:hypothetical protein